MRVSEVMLFQVVIGDLQRGRRNELALLEQIASGKIIQAPSDDPPKFIQIAGLKDTQAKIDQRQRNVDGGLTQLRMTENALSSAVDALIRMKELVVQMRNDTNTAADRATAALEVGQNINMMADLANAKNGDTSLFSGFSTRGRVVGVPHVFPITITNAVDDELTLTVDGVASGTIDLAAGVFATGPLLAAELEAKINADVNLTTAGKSVTVSFDTDHVVITSNSFGAGSTVEITGGTARTLTGLGGGATSSGAAPFVRVATTAADSANAGGGVISQGTVTDPNTTLLRNLEFTFTSPTAFDITDSDTGEVLSTGTPYTSGAAIDIVGFRVTIDDDPGPPAAGDVFSLKASYAYVGDGGEAGVEVGDGRTTKVAFAGSRVFSNSTVDVMGAMTNLQHALLSNNNNDQNFASQGVATKDAVVNTPVGTFDFNVGAGATSMVPVTVNMTLTELRDAINVFPGVEVTASIISDGPVATPHRLVLTPTNGGSDQTITITADTVPPLNFSLQDDLAGMKIAFEQIEAALDQMTAMIGEVGARQARLEGTKKGLDELNVLVPELLSQLEDTDLVAAISELTLQQFALEAAAISANRVFDTSLLNFLR